MRCSQHRSYCLGRLSLWLLRACPAKHTNDRRITRNCQGIAKVCWISLASTNPLSKAGSNLESNPNVKVARCFDQATATQLKPRLQMATDGYKWLQYSNIFKRFPTCKARQCQLGNFSARPQEFVRRQRLAADFPMLLFQRRLWGPMEWSASAKMCLLWNNNGIPFEAKVYLNYIYAL